MNSISKEQVDLAAARYSEAGSIGKFQKVNGATYSKNELINLVNNSSGDIYVRIGFDNNIMALYIGNERGEYITPSEGYCPTNCPFNN